MILLLLSPAFGCDACINVNHCCHMESLPSRIFIAGSSLKPRFENFRLQSVAVTGIAHCTLAWTCLNTAELAFDPRVIVITQCTRSSNAYRRLFSRRQSGQVVMLTSASRAEVMNEWIYTSALPVCLHGTCRELSDSLTSFTPTSMNLSRANFAFHPQTWSMTFSRHLLWKLHYLWNVIPCSLVDTFQSCRVT